MAAAHGVDLSAVSGTGPNGRVIRADIQDAMAAGVSAPAPKAATKAMPSAPSAGAFTDIENSQIRKVIADRLTYSK